MERSPRVRSWAAVPKQETWHTRCCAPRRTTLTDRALARPKLLRAGLALTLCLIAAAPLAAQPGPWEGRFVSTGDGAIWAVVAGARYRIQPVLITGDELAQQPEASGLATVDQLLGLVAPGAPAPVPSASAPAPAPAPVDAPSTLLGQSVRGRKNGMPFTVVVR